MAIVSFNDLSDLKKQKVGGGFPQPMRIQMSQGVKPSKKAAAPKRRHKVAFPDPSRKSK